MAEKKEIFNTELKIINIGIEMFADDLEKQNVNVIHVNWRPPAGGDIDILKLLEKLEGS
ncbi:MAG: fdrA domain protein [Promethearchaeota archaeon]